MWYVYGSMGIYFVGGGGLVRVKTALRQSTHPSKFSKLKYFCVDKNLPKSCSIFCFASAMPVQTFFPGIQ